LVSTALSSISRGCSKVKGQLTSSNHRPTFRTGIKTASGCIRTGAAWRAANTSCGRLEEIGGDYVAIQLGTLDDASAVELAEAPIKYANGRDNLWWTEPAETRHL
jgi:hypothetical protein